MKSFVAVIGLLVATASSAAASERFKLTIEQSGIYEVGYEELSAAGLAGELPSAEIGLSSAGEPVPLSMQDGGDGHFGPGDRLQFVGARLEGANSYFNEFSRYNVYWLATEAPDPLRWEAVDMPSAICPDEGLAPAGFVHLETDALRVRFRSRPSERGEAWFWARLSHVDDEAFELPLGLDDLDRQSGDKVRVVLGVRGWSRIQANGREAGESDHVLDIHLGDRLLARVPWDNRPDGFVTEPIELEAAELGTRG